MNPRQVHLQGEVRWDEMRECHKQTMVNYYLLSIWSTLCSALHCTALLRSLLFLSRISTTKSNPNQSSRLVHFQRPQTIGVPSIPSFFFFFFFLFLYLAMGWFEMYSMACAQEVILSASSSGISSWNSSSKAITTSTVSRESKPKSLVKSLLAPT